jgi:hypothetical protein
VLSLGSAATPFMAGTVEGDSAFERLEHPRFWGRVQAGEHIGEARRLCVAEATVGDAPAQTRKRS